MAHCDSVVVSGIVAEGGGSWGGNCPSPSLNFGLSENLIPVRKFSSKIAKFGLKNLSSVLQCSDAVVRMTGIAVVFGSSQNLLLATGLT